MHRFFTTDAIEEGGLITLADGEAAHLTRVLRLGTGARVVVFDGRGRAAEALVESVKPALRLRVGEAVQAAPEPRVRLTLAAAVLKGEASDQVVRDAVMLGAAAIQPVISERTEMTGTALERGRRRERWERIALSSAKQCGRAVLPAIATPVDLRAFLRAPHEGLPLMLVEPQAASADRQTLSTLRDRTVPSAATLIVGPEGGWATHEIGEAHEAGWTLLTLGARTLRADAAPQVVIAALWAIWGEI
jgi:16S rRNA (uracil1498-N3)-methyltransferase